MLIGTWIPTIWLQSTDAHMAAAWDLEDGAMKQRQVGWRQDLLKRLLPLPVGGKTEAHAALMATTSLRGDSGSRLADPV